MDALLNWLWQGAVVALALALMLRILDRTRAHVRYAVCWAALFIVSALPLVPLVRGAVSPLEPVSATIAGPIVSVPQAWWTSDAVLIAAWALWVCFAALQLARAALALRGAKRRSHILATTIERSLRHWARMRDHGRRATLVVSDRVKAAAVLGGRSPLIALAPALVSHLEPDELDHVIIHEWAHVQRRDDVAIVLQLIVRLVAGWHPAVWWIDRRLRIEREVACDEMTVSITASRKSYAACLVKLAGLPLTRVAALPAPGVLMSTGIRERVVRIVSRSDCASPSWSRGAATVGVALLVALSLTVGGFQLVDAAVPSPGPPSRPGTAGASAEPHVPSMIGAGRTTPSKAVEWPQPPDARPRVVRAEASVASPLPGALQSESPRVTPAAPEPAADGAPAAPLDSVPIALPVSFSPAPAVQPAAADAATTSPWSTAADAGVAIARGSKNAGVATAGFFNRVGRRIADSF